MQRASRLLFLGSILLISSACTGPEGPAGPAGEAGPPGITDYSVIAVESPVDETPTKQVRAECPAGSVATGAGWAVLDPTGAILEGRATYFQPAYDGSHWLVNARNDSAFAPEWKLRVRVICVRIAMAPEPSSTEL